MIDRGFERAKQLRENRGAVRQFAIERAWDILRAAGVVDPKLRVGAQPTVASTTEAQVRKREDSRATSPGLLAEVAREFNNGPLTPELVTRTFQEVWQVRGEIAGLELAVTPCDRTKKELDELVKAGRRIGYLPEEVSTQQDRPLLAKMFPELGSYSVQKGNPVTNEINRAGWFDYEADIDAPYPDTTEQKLVNAIAAEEKRLGRALQGMNVSEYIVAGEDSKLFTGSFLDQEGKTWARLLGSRGDGEVVSAVFDSVGRLDVNWFLFSRSQVPFLGGRSVGVKST